MFRQTKDETCRERNKYPIFENIGNFSKTSILSKMNNADFRKLKKNDFAQTKILKTILSSRSNIDNLIWF